MSNSFFDFRSDVQISVAAARQARSLYSIRIQAGNTEPLPGQPGKNPGDIATVQSGETAWTVLVSAGVKEKASTETFRQIGGALARWLRQNKVVAADLDLDTIETFGIVGAVYGLLEGILLGAYRFDRYKQPESNPFQGSSILLYSADPASTGEILNRAVILTRAVNLSRDWAHEPANIINPISLAERAAALAAKYGLKCTILDEKMLVEIGAGAILAVGQGSKTPSRLIVVEYPGKNPAPDAKPVVLVGKALTFDTGGYSLKGVENILGMKYDKCGGITVLATLQAAAELGLRTPIVGIVGASENMVSGEAYRPDDIITSLSGKTIEIISTDAEGRLVLADALTYAQTHFNPVAVIDLATLTGGVVVALGRIRAGLLSNDDTLAGRLFDAGERTGEKLWRLPLDEEYAKLIQGDDADIKNSGGREGQSITAGMFLKEFIKPETVWAHLDIAGVADSPKDLPYCQKGATGFGVRLLIDYLSFL